MNTSIAPLPLVNQPMRRAWRRRCLRVLLACSLMTTGFDAVRAVDGIAISTHRESGSDSGVGVAPSIFGSVVRHTIKDGKVTDSKVLYDGKARCAVINQAGTKVAFIKLDGKIQVMNMDGTGLKELANSQNHNASWLAWPNGDWIYYSMQGRWPTGDWMRAESSEPETRLIRRINTVTGEDEEVGKVKGGIWQLSLAANATKGSGRFAIVGWVMDFANPGEALNPKEMRCGTGVSFNGSYVTEVQETHSEVRIYEWPANRVLTSFKVNEFTSAPDGRHTLYRPRWAVNSDAWIVFTNGMDFGGTKQSNMVLYDWKDRQQIQVTNNPLTGEASDEGDAFWVAGVANDLAGYGLIEGEAPLTTTLGEGLLQGDWVWNFGDGSTATAPFGKHTFAKPGVYTVTATQGGKTLKQSVTVLERKQPSVSRADVLDDRHIAITFDEPVTIESGAAVSVKGGSPAKTVVPLTESSRVLTSWDGPIPRDGVLEISGIRDQAQEPNEIKEPTVAYKAPVWPVNREALSYVWTTKNDQSTVYNPVSKKDERCTVFVWNGLAQFTRDGAMDIGPNGNFTGGRPFTAGLNAMSFESGGTSFEAVIQPGSIDDPAERIIMFVGGYGGGTPRQLVQKGAELSFGIHVTDQSAPRGTIPVATLKDARPFHLVITYSSGKLITYINGKAVSEKTEFTGAPAKTHNGGSINLGSFIDKAEKNAWKGTMQNVAFYGRELSADEVAKNYAVVQQNLAGRKQVSSVAVSGQLVATSAVASVADIAPYDNALIMNEYKVLTSSDPKVISVGGKVRVAQWGVQRKEVLPINKLPAGGQANLVLEKLSDNPQVESIFLRDKLPEDFDAEVYFDIRK